jgi:hypothetical protein
MGVAIEVSPKHSVGVNYECASAATHRLYFSFPGSGRELCEPLRTSIKACVIGSDLNAGGRC